MTGVGEEVSRELALFARMTKRERDTLTYAMLRTARQAASLGDGPDKRTELRCKVNELQDLLARLLDRPVGGVPLTEDSQMDLVRNAAELAVLLRAHNWAHSDLTMENFEGGSTVENAGERAVDSGFDALGALFLPTASAEDWATEIIRDAAKGEPAMEAAVKFGRYVLHPTPLLILNDATRMLGEALYSSNVRRLVGCVHEIHATMDRGCGPGTSLRPRGARRRTRVRAVGPGVPSSRDDAVSTVDEPQRPNGVENVGRRSEGLGGRSL